LGDGKSFDFCVDGIEKGSIIAVSTLGSRKLKDLYLKGFCEMCRIIQPSHILCYYEPFEEMRQLADITVIPYEGIEVRRNKLTDKGVC